MNVVDKIVRFFRPGSFKVFRRYRFSHLHNLYTQIFRANDWADMLSEVAFYRGVLGERCSLPLVIFDVGANAGFKAEVFRRLGARVICFEPDRTSINNLKMRFAKYPSVQIVSAAVSDTEGIRTLMIDEEGSALNTLSPEWKNELARSTGESSHSRGVNFDKNYAVRTTTLAKAVIDFGRPIFVKIDVEGHELEVIRGMNESFDFLSFECNLPIFRNQTLESVKILKNRNPHIGFNATKGKLEFVFDDWQSAEAITDFVEKTECTYFEIFAKRTTI